MNLIDLGWNTFFEHNFEEFKNLGYTPLRIIRENRGKYIACNEAGEFLSEVTGKFRFANTEQHQFPAVGDWVAATLLPDEQKALIHAVLPRKSLFSRKAAGETTAEQPVAANIDTVFIVTGLDSNYNIRRIERLLSIAWESGAIPVILLNKSDLCPQAEEKKLEVESISAGVDVYTLSAYHPEELIFLNKYLKSGKTVAFLGSSGVGKSTLINALLGENLLKVNSVSEAGDRGRHTTTFRELLVLPDGGMVIDTPGMREIQVWGDEDGVEKVFHDINDLSQNCRFNDCSHQHEPGCAVQDAIIMGVLDNKRFESYLKLKKEFAYLADRQTMKASALEKARWKQISILCKNFKEK